MSFNEPPVTQYDRMTAAEFHDAIRGTRILWKHQVLEMQIEIENRYGPKGEESPAYQALGPLLSALELPLNAPPEGDTLLTD